MTESRARSAVERAARESFGRLVAFLASRSGDIAAAEDALAQAFKTALERWPRDGVPSNPDAWLLTAARRRLLDVHRHARVTAEAADRLRQVQEEAQAMAERGAFPDDRLKLMFACAHPALDPNVRTPLVLQAVLGLDSARIASAFLVSPDAMMKRLTRAKLRLREAGVAFSHPRDEDLPDRVEDVLAAIYAAFTLGSDDRSAEVRGEALAEEAIWLARVAAELLPSEAEAKGLLALLLFSFARADARRDDAGAYTPLESQDTSLWSEPLIREAETVLRAAGRLGKPGRYQLEAAIQAVHADRRRTGSTDWKAIVNLYDALLHVAPSLGAHVARAAAISKAGDPEAALAALEAAGDPRIDGYQPYWATRAHVLETLGQAAPAALAYARAAGLTEDAAVREYLLSKRARLARVR
jgi:RNA polymerase sigma-70 factor (ECF subfamily)